MAEIKKGVLIFIIIVLLIIPVAYAFNLLDFLNQGMEAITGMGSAAVTVSISVGNDAPNITDIMLNAQTIAPTTGAIRYYEVSFLANDSQGLSNLDNDSAKVNVSLIGSEQYNYSNYSCSHVYDDTAKLIRYNCTIALEYYWPDSSSWRVEAEINDSNNNHIQNASSTWTYSELTSINLSSNSLAWASVTPDATNQTSSTTMTLENKGNIGHLNITTTINNLYASSGKYIPALNFSVGNMSGAENPQCESTNQTGDVTEGVNPIVGLNETAQYTIFNSLVRGQGVKESLYYCLFEVPSANEIESETYNTDMAGAWDITVGA